MIEGYFSDVELISAIHYGYELIDTQESILYHKTSFNSPEYKG